MRLWLGLWLAALLVIGCSGVGAMPTVTEVERERLVLTSNQPRQHCISMNQPVDTQIACTSPLATRPFIYVQSFGDLTIIALLDPTHQATNIRLRFGWYERTFAIPPTNETEAILPSLSGDILEVPAIGKPMNYIVLESDSTPDEVEVMDINGMVLASFSRP